MHPERKKMRLSSWNYSDVGIYFLTFCTKDKKPILSHIVGHGILDVPERNDDRVLRQNVPDGPQRGINKAVCFSGNAASLPQLTHYGKTVQDTLLFLVQSDSKWKLHHYVIMPNHVHLLLECTDTAQNCGGASRMPHPTDAAIPKFVSSVKRHTNRVCRTQLWQDGYYDHVIRDEDDFLRIWKYIDENPLKWTDDVYFSSEE